MKLAIPLLPQKVRPCYVSRISVVLPSIMHLGLSTVRDWNAEFQEIVVCNVAARSCACALAVCVRGCFCVCVTSVFRVFKDGLWESNEDDRIKKYTQLSHLASDFVYVHTPHTHTAHHPPHTAHPTIGHPLVTPMHALVQIRCEDVRQDYYWRTVLSSEDDPQCTDGWFSRRREVHRTGHSL